MAIKAIKNVTIKYTSDTKQLDRVPDKFDKIAKKSKKSIGEIGTKSKKSFKEASKSADKYGGSIKKLGGSIRSMGAILGVAIGGAIVLRGISNMINQFETFEKTITNVKTLLSAEDLKNFGGLLEEGSIRLMEKYGLAIEDTNKALFDAISAGVPAAESIEFLDVASKLAIAGVTDLTTAVDGITSVMNAYSLSTSEAEKVASAFFTAQKFGKTTVSELSESIGLVAPVAKLANISYQELLSTFAILTKQGIKTTEAATAIRATISAIINPAENAAKVFKELGISTGLTAIKEEGFAKILGQVSAAAKDNADKLTELIPNVRALTGVGALGTEQLKEYDEILRAVNEDVGEGSSLHKALGEQMKTAAQQTAIQTAEIRTLQIEIGKKLSPVILSIKRATLKWFKDWLVDMSNTRVGLGLLGRDLISVFGLFEKRALTAKEAEIMFEKHGVKSGGRVKDVIGGLKLENAAVISSGEVHKKYIDILINENWSKKEATNLINKLIESRKIELGLIDKAGDLTVKGLEVAREEMMEKLRASAKRIDITKLEVKSQQDLIQFTGNLIDKRNKEAGLITESGVVAKKGIGIVQQLANEKMDASNAEIEAREKAIELSKEEIAARKKMHQAAIKLANAQMAFFEQLRDEERKATQDDFRTAEKDWATHLENLQNIKTESDEIGASVDQEFLDASAKNKFLTAKTLKDRLIALELEKNAFITAQGELTALELENIQIEFAKREKELKKENIKEIAFFILDAAEQLASALLNLQAIKEQAETNKALNELDTRLKNKQISQDEFDTQREVILKEQFEKDKKRAKAQVKIEAAIAAAKTFAQMGFLLALPFVALLAARMAIEIATINAQEFEEGGYTGDGNTKEVAGTVHKGEFVSDAPTTAKYRPVLQAMHEGKFEDYIMKEMHSKHGDSFADNVKNSYEFAKYNDRKLRKTVSKGTDISRDNTNQILIELRKMNSKRRTWSDYNV